MLKLQYFDHLMLRADSLGKTLMLGKIEGMRRKWTTEDEMVGWHHWLNGHKCHYQEIVKDRGAWRAAVLGVAKSWTQLRNWTTKKYILVTWVIKDMHTYISYKWRYHNHTPKRKNVKTGEIELRCIPLFLHCTSMNFLVLAVVRLHSHVWLRDFMDCSMPGLLVPHDILEFAQV